VSPDGPGKVSLCIIISLLYTLVLYAY
jgi:hypothetical protein